MDVYTKEIYFGKWLLEIGCQFTHGISLGFLINWKSLCFQVDLLFFWITFRKYGE